MIYKDYIAGKYSDPQLFAICVLKCFLSNANVNSTYSVAPQFYYLIKAMCDRAINVNMLTKHFILE